MLEERLLRAALYVERHLGEPITLERLADEACISTYHFHRLFRLWLGEPVMEYVRRLRIEHAAYRLRASTRPVQAIARDVGYASADAFGRAFRERFGESPREYRARWVETRPPAEDSAASMARRAMSSVPQSVETPARVRVTRLDAWYLIGLRHLGPYQGVWRTWATLAEWAAHEAPALLSAPRIGISHDDPGMVNDESQIRYDACYAVGAADADAMRALARLPLHWREMPAADYAITIHRGAYDALGDSYRRLFIDWLPRSGRYPGNAPVVEWYRNSPREVPEEELRTALLLPLE